MELGQFSASIGMMSLMISCKVVTKGVKNSPGKSITLATALLEKWYTPCRFRFNRDENTTSTSTDVILVDWFDARDKFVPTVREYPFCSRLPAITAQEQALLYFSLNEMKSSEKETHRSIQLDSD